MSRFQPTSINNRSRYPSFSALNRAGQIENLNQYASPSSFNNDVRDQDAFHDYDLPGPSSRHLNGPSDLKQSGLPTSYFEQYSSYPNASSSAPKFAESTSASAPFQQLLRDYYAPAIENHISQNGLDLHDFFDILTARCCGKVPMNPATQQFVDEWIDPVIGYVQAAACVGSLILTGRLCGSSTEVLLEVCQSLFFMCEAKSICNSSFEHNPLTFLQQDTAELTAASPVDRDMEQASTAMATCVMDHLKACNEKCQNSNFNTRGHGNNCNEIPTGDKPHQCVVCSKCFSKQEDLSRHIDTYDPRKLYICPFHQHCRCSLFTRKEFLRKHLESAGCKSNHPVGTDVESMLSKAEPIYTGEISRICPICRKRMEKISWNAFWKNHVPTCRDDHQKQGRPFNARNVQVLVIPASGVEHATHHFQRSEDPFALINGPAYPVQAGVDSTPHRGLDQRTTATSNADGNYTWFDGPPVVSPSSSIIMHGPRNSEMGLPYHASVGQHMAHGNMQQDLAHRPSQGHMNAQTEYSNDQQSRNTVMYHNDSSSSITRVGAPPDRRKKKRSLRQMTRDGVSKVMKKLRSNSADTGTECKDIVSGDSAVSPMPWTQNSPGCLVKALPVTESRTSSWKFKFPSRPKKNQ